MTLMNRNQGEQPGSSVRGVVSGVIFLALFGTLWAIIGINGLHGLGENWLAGIAAVIGLALVGGGVVLIRRARKLSANPPEVKGRGRQNRNRWFLIVFGTEVIFILAASVICRAINRFDLFFPVMMLIVGLHFFPLAYLFKVRIYILAGVLLCLVSLITIFVVPERLNLGGLQIALWWVVSGFCGAIILWGSGVVQLFRGINLLKRKNNR